MMTIKLLTETMFAQHTIKLPVTYLLVYTLISTSTCCLASHGITVIQRVKSIGSTDIWSTYI